MGNTSSSVTAGVKDQADAGSRELYRLVNLSDGGELMHVMKATLRSNDFTEIDKKILAEVY